MSEGPYGPPSPQPGQPEHGYQPPGYQPSGPPAYQPPQPPQQPGGYPQNPGSPQNPGYPQDPGYPQNPGHPPNPGYPPQGYPPPGPPQTSSNKGLWIGLGIAGVVLLLLCCGGTGFAVYSGIQRANEEVERVIDESTTTPTPTDTATPGGSTTDGKVGEPVRLKDLEFTIGSRPTCSSAAIAGVQPRSGQFCQFPLKVVNKGSASLTWSCSRVTLETDRRETNFYSLTGSRAVNNTSCLTSIAAGATWNIVVVYDVDTGDTPRKAEFTEDFRDYVKVTF
jgi:hypothetical protein